MKQWVNLYRNELRPVRRQLTFKRVSRGLGAWLALLLAVVIAVKWHHSSVEQANEKLSTALTQLNDSLAKTRERIDSRQPSQQLLDKKEELERKLQDISEFQQHINQFQSDKSSEVERFLRELAGITPKNIWLTDFSIAGDNIRLHGFALNSEALVLWMDKFNQSALLSSKSFSVVELKRNEKGYQQFLLQSIRAKEDKNHD
ncbi:PilN domain-containing protein [Idiomarina sp. HP20-50]|uniref:PilN domain-containing protein n=1 Tax=Idiomarina sp. HP20-50 TaxID=3070813 RepID=UPI00294B6442|nr:PilN domain-containing protein [Idiomarina sp. HP20-50]MDV6315936.1 PilN domain-containing protein [Idiomarina sp. HP20-50]